MKRRDKRSWRRYRRGAPDSSRPGCTDNHWHWNFNRGWGYPKTVHCGPVKRRIVAWLSYLALEKDAPKSQCMYILLETTAAVIQKPVTGGLNLELSILLTRHDRMRVLALQAPVCDSWRKVKLVRGVIQDTGWSHDRGRPTSHPEWGQDFFGSVCISNSADHFSL